MIRISQLAALDINKIDVSKDLDILPKLYAYQATVSGRTNTLLLQGDTAPQPQNTRNNALAPFWNNVLLGTSNFYPEQALGLTSFHMNSELHEVLNVVTLPTIEFKKASLFFSQGVVGDASIVGHYIKVYCKKANGTEVILASIVDFANDSNILAKSPKLFESQIFNEALDFEFVDVEYLLSSSTPEVQAIKLLLFGNERPTEYFIEYSAFTDESVDNFVENSLQFTRINMAVVNTQTMPITFENSEMLAEVKLSQNNFAISSQMIHQRFDIESYLNTLKQPGEEYIVEHIFTVNCFNSDDELIQTFSQKISNPTNQFDTILYRPIVDLLTNHFTVETTIRIENVNSGLIMRRDSMIVVTDESSHNFKAQETFSLSNLDTYNIQNVVNRQVNKIVQSAEVPKIVQIEKKLFVQSQELDELQLVDADFTVDLKTTIDVSGNAKLFLKMDNLVIENETNELLRFRLPKVAYATSAAKYLLLDSGQNLVATGRIRK